MNKRISLLGLLIFAVLTAIAFTAGGGAAQTTGSSTAGTGSAAATRPATGSVVATRPATSAVTATRAATGSVTAVATGTGGVTTVPVSGTTGRARASSLNFVLIEGLVLGLAVVGTGIMLRRRASRE